MGLNITIKTIKINNIVGTSLSILKNFDDFVFLFKLKSLSNLDK